MHIPKTLRIFGHTLEIKLVSSENQRGKGTYDSWYHIINLNEGLSESQQAETFLHEIFECIKDEIGLTLSHEELSTLSLCIFTCIRDNNLDFRNQKDASSGKKTRKQVQGC